MANDNVILKKEKGILFGLKKNMEFNLEELKTEIETTKNGYMASLSLLDLAKPQITDYSETEVDSLISVMINNFAVYNPSTGSIDEIINSGQLNLVQNEELRNQVTNWSELIISSILPVDGL